MSTRPNVHNSGKETLVVSRVASFFFNVGFLCAQGRTFTGSLKLVVFYLCGGEGGLGKQCLHDPPQLGARMAFRDGPVKYAHMKFSHKKVQFPRAVVQSAALVESLTVIQLAAL